jgi:hypothetical protein
MLVEAKKCNKCFHILPLDSFHKDSTKEDKKVLTCKGCKKQYDKAKRSSIENRDKRRWINLMQRYGLTKDEYLSMFQEQCGCCKICNTHQLDLKRPLVVDHCHSTMKVRGLLCDNCNNGLGKFKDSEEFLKKAIDYLKKTKED